MYYSTRSLLLSALLASIPNLSQAQGSGRSTSTGAPSSVSLSPCVIGCFQQATGCPSYTDAACACSNTQFQSTSRQCVQSNCPAIDLQAALAFEVQACNAASSSSLTTLPGTASSQSPSGIFTIETSTNVPIHTSTSAPGNSNSLSMSTPGPSSASSVSTRSSSSATGPAPGSSTSGTGGAAGLQSNHGWVQLVCGILAGVVGGALLVL